MRIVIADYLKLQDTAALWNFIDDEKIKLILEAYLTERQWFFESIDSNVTKKKQKSTKLKKINSHVLHQIIQNSNYMWFMLQIMNVVFIFSVVRLNLIAVVLILNFITRLVRAASWTFSSSMLLLIEQFWLNSEDIHHRFYFLKHVWKCNQEFCKKKKCFQNKSAVQIIYRNQNADIIRNLILITVKTETLQQQSDDTRLSNCNMSTQEQLNYASYKDVVRNSDNDKTINDLKNNWLFDSNMSDTMMQLIADLNKIFEKHNN